MDEREKVPGLGIGQVVGLAFGFFLASVLIFAFGFWVGYDLAQQRLAREQEIVRLPTGPPPTPLPTATRRATRPVLPTVTVTPAVKTATARPPVKTKTPKRTPTRTLRKAPTATATAVRPTPTRYRATETSAAVGRWSVQVRATKDAVQAAVLAHSLRTKGYDAYTVTGTVRGLMWYRVRVGRFESRVNAKVMELRLKEEAKLKEAFIVRQ